MFHQVSHKGLLRKCKEAKSYLVETGNFLSNLRDGAREEPKFESDHLEGQNSNNHLKENPDVLSRLGLKQEQNGIATLHTAQFFGGNFIKLIEKQIQQ